MEDISTTITTFGGGASTIVIIVAIIYQVGKNVKTYFDRRFETYVTSESSENTLELEQKKALFSNMHDTNIKLTNYILKQNTILWYVILKNKISKEDLEKLGIDFINISTDIKTIN